MKPRYTVPLAIVVGGALVAVAVYFAFYRASPQTANVDPAAVAAVDSGDHILGNPDAPVVFIEYSDLDCAYCQKFESTMEALIGAYGESGKVALVYRHFPLPSDPDSENEAEAAECVAAEGGDAKFFHFIDLVAAAAPPDQFDSSGYPAILSTLGLDANSFNACVSSGTYANKVANEAANAAASGATGAPYTIMLVNGSNPTPISGLFTYAQMKELTDAVLAKLQSE